jgi:hypothetical protein
MNMAKKAKAPKAKAKKAGKGRAAKGLTQDVERASAIVAHVLSHFGGGYEAQRQTENPTAPPTSLEIYKRPSDLRNFHSALLESTLRNLEKLDWETNTGLRNQIISAAFAHGVLARKKVVSDGTITLKLVQILTTLETIQQQMCSGPGGLGGGPVCDF